MSEPITDNSPERWSVYLDDLDDMYNAHLSARREDLHRQTQLLSHKAQEVRAQTNDRLNTYIPLAIIAPLAAFTISAVFEFTMVATGLTIGLGLSVGIVAGYAAYQCFKGFKEASRLSDEAHKARVALCDIAKAMEKTRHSVPPLPVM